MTIIQIESKNGFHNIETQSHREEVWVEGYVEVPAELESIVWESGGYCDLTIQDGVLIRITPTGNLDPDYLSKNKTVRIEQSRADLAAYLESHPLLWTDGEYYSITKDKQQQLTSKLAVAQAKATMGVPYELKWNTTEEVCVPWELSDLYALAFAIDERVTALVTYQQEQEVKIRNASTQEELDAIVVDYDTVV